MKRNRTLGKFLKRNERPVILYTVAMGLLILIPVISEKLRLIQSMQLGLMALITTIFIGYLNYQYAQDRLFKDLFKEFNERYDKFNDHFDQFRDCYPPQVSLDEIKKEDVKIVVDYLNLCAEEYFWFEKGRIDEQAWASWETGMKTWAALPVVRTVFYNEIATWTTSYYLGFQDFFAALTEDV